MLKKIRQINARINIQLPGEIKEKLYLTSSKQGKKVSAFVRESIEEKILRFEKQIFEEKMRSAYKELADENLKVAEEFKFSDAENLSEATP
ncbi:MAG: hypothetical protein AB1585_11290 [Thermodesulfobacteriota bacterium]